MVLWKGAAQLTNCKLELIEASVKTERCKCGEACSCISRLVELMIAEWFSNSSGLLNFEMRDGSSGE